MGWGEGVIIYLKVNPPNAWGKNSKEIGRVRVKGGGTRPTLRKPESIKKNESWLKGSLVPYAPKELMEGPLKLHVMVCWPYLKNEKKSVVKEGALIPKHTTPDGNNILASVADVMEGIFYKNDSQLYCEHIEKWYGPEGFIRIEVSQ